jgi:hypothetical protein
MVGEISIHYDHKVAGAMFEAMNISSPEPNRGKLSMPGLKVSRMLHTKTVDEP